MIWLLFWQHSQAIIFIKNGHPDWVSGGCERDARDTNMINELRAQSRGTGPEKLTSAYFWSPQTPTHFISGFTKWMTLQTYFSTDLIPSKFGSYHVTFFPISPRVSVIDCLIPLDWFGSNCGELDMVLFRVLGHLSHFRLFPNLLSLGVIIKTGQPGAPAREHKS